MYIYIDMYVYMTLDDTSPLQHINSYHTYTTATRHIHPFEPQALAVTLDAIVPSDEAHTKYFHHNTCRLHIQILPLRHILTAYTTTTAHVDSVCFHYNTC